MQLTHEPQDARPPAALLPAASNLFGPRLELAIAYAGLLTTDAVVRGLIGPREASRIWDRHLLNCAVVGELVPENARLVDVGSGAGLPGLVLALARPDLSVVLIESLARRCLFLDETVSRLALDNVTVIRARAEEVPPRQTVEPADVVTARAVAPLDRLAGWCLPLTRVGGRLLAIKGDSAGEEIQEHEAAVTLLGGGTPVVRTCGVGVIDPPTTVVEIERVRAVESGTRLRQASGGRRSGSKGQPGSLRPSRGKGRR